MSNYSELLERFAHYVGLSPAEELLRTEEIEMGGMAIGLMNEGGDAGDVIFFTRLGQPKSTDDLQAVFKLMLQANALWSGTGGNTLGLHEPSGEVILCGRVPLALCSAQVLAGLLDGFTDAALVWRETIQGETPVALASVSA